MSRPLLAAAALTAFALSAGSARADEDTAPRAPAPAPEYDLLCRSFAVDPTRAGGDPINTADETEEVGQWVAEQRPSGWAVHSSDFELGTTPTGSLIAYTQICLSRPR